MNDKITDEKISNLTTLTFIDLSLNTKITEECLCKFPFLSKTRLWLNTTVSGEKLAVRKPGIVILK